MAGTTDPVAAPSSPLNLGQESNLSNWAGPYVTDMLGRGWGLADQGFDAYQGPLTAGASPLQEQAFSGIAGLAVPDGTLNASDNLSGIGDQMQGLSYDPSNMDFNRWDNNWADQYMNPYLQQALDPVLAEQRRQSDITRLNDTSRLTKAGAFGGGRQAIMESELNDNTARLMNETTGRGYKDAYDTAFGNFSSDEGRRLDTMRSNEDSRQFGAKYGLEALQGSMDANRLASETGSTATRDALDIINAQGDMGRVDRGILQEGMDADRGQFEQEREWPYKQTQFMQSLLQGLPLEAQSNSFSQSSPFDTFIASMASGQQGLQSFLDFINGGNSSGGTTTPPIVGG